MTASAALKPPAQGRTARLFVLDIGGGHIFSIDPDGSDKKPIVSDARNPDGVAIDAGRGHVYWTNMGVPSLNDGSIERADLDGSNRTFIVPPGGTHTPKQILLDQVSGKLYWSDREGMRVMRCNLDGSELETLIQTGEGDEDRKDQTRWCVGIAVDHDRNEIWWTQKGPDNGNVGRLFRAPLDIDPGETARTRSDIELIKDGLPEPIDLEIANGWIYWTDRGDPPRGNNVNRMRLDPGETRRVEIVSDHLMEGIGIALDVANSRMFVTDLAGSIYSGRLDGSDWRMIAAVQGNLTGIAYAEIQPFEGDIK